MVRLFGDKPALVGEGRYQVTFREPGVPENRYVTRTVWIRNNTQILYQSPTILRANTEFWQNGSSRQSKIPVGTFGALFEQALSSAQESGLQNTLEREIDPSHVVRSEQGRRAILGLEFPPSEPASAELLAELRAGSGALPRAHVGWLIAKEGSRASVAKPALHVRVRPESGRRALFQRARDYLLGLRLDAVQPFPMPNWYRVDAAGAAYEDMQLVASKLSVSPEVELVEFEVAGTVTTHADGHADFWDGELWAFPAVGIPNDRAQFGAKQILHVVDPSFTFDDGGAPVTGELSGTITVTPEGPLAAPQVRNKYLGNSTPGLPGEGTGHGLSVASILCASDDGLAAEGVAPIQGFGARGVLPLAQWVSTQLPNSVDGEQLVEAIYGMQETASGPASMVVITSDFDVASQQASLLAAITQLSLTGRRRRGTPFFVSAGRPDLTITLGTEYHPLMITCGSVVRTGTATYAQDALSKASNHVDLCAPTTWGDRNLPGFQERLQDALPSAVAFSLFGTITSEQLSSTLRFSLPDGLESELTPYRVGGLQVVVRSLADPEARMVAQISDVSAPTSIELQPNEGSVPDGGCVVHFGARIRAQIIPGRIVAYRMKAPDTVSGQFPLYLIKPDDYDSIEWIRGRYVPAEGELGPQVVFPDNSKVTDYLGVGWLCEVLSATRLDFGQTSAATPLCAGVGGMLMHADPELPMTAVRGLLWETATSPSATPTGTISDPPDGEDKFGAYRDPANRLNGTQHTKEFGFGVIRADSAVNLGVELEGANGWPRHKLRNGTQGPLLASPDISVNQVGDEVRVQFEVKNVGQRRAWPGMHFRVSLLRTADNNPLIPTSTTPVEDDGGRRLYISDLNPFEVPSLSEPTVALEPGAIYSGSHTFRGVTLSERPGETWRAIVEILPHDGKSDARVWDCDSAAQDYIVAPDTTETEANDHLRTSALVDEPPASNQPISPEGAPEVEVTPGEACRDAATGLNQSATHLLDQLDRIRELLTAGQRPPHRQACDDAAANTGRLQVLGRQLDELLDLLRSQDRSR